MDGCEGSQLYPPTPPIMLQVNCMTPLRLHQKLITFSSGRRDQPFQHSRTRAYTECVIGLCYDPRVASQLYAVDETKSKHLILCKIQLPVLDTKEGREKKFFSKVVVFFFCLRLSFCFPKGRISLLRSSRRKTTQRPSQNFFLQSSISGKYPHGFIQNAEVFTSASAMIIIIISSLLCRAVHVCQT